MAGCIDISLMKLRLSILLGAVLSTVCLSSATVSLPALLSDHALLQRSERTRIWGRAEPGEQVRVTLGSATASATAAPDGRWQLELDLRSAPALPLELIAEGSNRVVSADVAVGEIWVCSGQSNMEWTMQGTDDLAAEIRRPVNPGLRQFVVKRGGPRTPSENCDGRWVVAAPDTIRDFTGVGYYFGREVQQKTNAAVGLLNASAAGTPIEPWISSAGIEKTPALKAGDQRIQAYEIEYQLRFKHYREVFESWCQTHGRGDTAGPRDLGRLEAGKWTAFTPPGRLVKVGLPDSGVVWLRKTITVPPPVLMGLDRGFLLTLGRLNEFDEVYWNGIKVGESNYRTAGANGAKRYRVPDELVHPGERATITLRLYAPAGGAGFEPSPLIFSAGAAPLAGEWSAQSERRFEPLSEIARASYPRQPDSPGSPASRLFNGVINPLMRTTIRGVIWYQGESNVSRAFQYRETFAVLINDWREQWGQGPFPFYFCQLANYGLKGSAPTESGWAELRESQSATLALPNTGQAILIDVGEELNDHPRNKRDVGKRLALIALAKTYGQVVDFEGPSFRSMTTEAGKIRLHFEHVKGGLMAKPLPDTYRPRSLEPDERPLAKHNAAGPLEGFMICGEDRVWKWAHAVIDRDTVMVWEPTIPAPKAVRYAWADNPTCNLYNGVGLPAVPFRTDAWPPITLNKQ